MVALRDREVGVDVVGFFLVLGGPIEDLAVSVCAWKATFGTDSMATITTISAVHPIFSAMTIIFCR